MGVSTATAARPRSRSAAQASSPWAGRTRRPFAPAAPCAASPFRCSRGSVLLLRARRLAEIRDRSNGGDDALAIGEREIDEADPHARVRVVVILADRVHPLHRALQDEGLVGVEAER